MNEATITHQLLTYLRQHLRGPCLKHADKSLIGLPDASVTNGGATQWVEVKLVKVGPKKRVFDLATIVGFGKPQSRLMGLLDLHGRSYYVIFFNAGPGEWKTMVIGAVAMANRCHAKMKIDYDLSEDLGDLTKGKDFERVLQKLKENMNGDGL
jgi:hypothetical protein